MRIHFAWLMCTSLFLNFTSSLWAQTMEVLPGTKPLTLTGDLSFEVVDRVDRFLLEMTAHSEREREALWTRDFRSADAYRRSIEANRARFSRYIGLLDERVPAGELELVAKWDCPALVAETSSIRISAVRWKVLPGVDAEGLLVEPRGVVKAQIIALPEADWTPEAVTGVTTTTDGVPYGLALAESGCRVLIPTIINRDVQWSGNPEIEMTNQTHREFVYRQAFFMGRHVIGYEVQKVLAAVDYFKWKAARTNAGNLPVAVVGYGEGGLVAFYSAAVDERIDAAWISGYFQPREGVWEEPVYRNVWGLLTEFGDAEIASLIAPRCLLIEASKGPEVPGPPPHENGEDYAASGVLRSPDPAAIRQEFERARKIFAALKMQDRIRLVAGNGENGRPGFEKALSAFLGFLGIEPRRFERQTLLDARRKFDPNARWKRQFDQLGNYSKELVRSSPFRRKKFWSGADKSSVQAWKDSTSQYRDYLWKEIVGWLPPADIPASPRTRLIYETAKWKGYEVVLDIWPSVITYGILLVPGNLRAGERRPVVITQHGRGGRPQDVCSPYKEHRAYHSFGARLADLGFVVYAPQNLYIGEEKYRVLQRKANPLKLTFFGLMARQHERILEWLATLTYVDAERIGFYGLSYGGKSAMLLPALLQKYALSICSGDFNETVWKHVSTSDPFSFMFTNEYEHTEFDFGDKFNYAELAGLIAPRPFMVERGHRDGVAPDEWVAYEYAKVRKLYVELGIPENTTIEFFNGVHEIHLTGTLDFLRRHLRWSE